MTGMLVPGQTRVIVRDTTEMIGKLRGFAVHSSVNGHAQTAVIIGPTDKALVAKAG